MKNINILDVTLRDGGCVNDFNFGATYMEKILAAQETAGIDIIELGYIDDKKGSKVGRTQYINEQVIEDCILHSKKTDVTYVTMIDYGKYDIDKLANRTSTGIDGIRLAFHKKNYKDVLKLGRNIIDKGYKLFIQPMITFRYSDLELLDLIEKVNEELPDASAFYIVDSFGEMRPSDLVRVLSLVDHNLIGSMPIGFHSHNNLQLAYSNACALMEFPTDRDIIIDSSIMGMGKGAGNLNTELLIEHLNKYFHKKYLISPLLTVTDEVINQIRAEYNWGYSVEYYLSSINHCTPSYAGHFYNKHMLSIDQVNELLSMIADEKKISFDKEYAEELYRQFNSSKSIDDSLVVSQLKEKLIGKRIVLIAPGKSVGRCYDDVNRIIKSNDYIVIGLNATVELDFDYILTTRVEIYKQEAAEGKCLIVPSNVSNNLSKSEYVLDYDRWINSDEKVHDSSADIIFNLLSYCEVEEILLAGFDGFSVDVNENYYDNNMRHPVNQEQAELRNSYFKSLINGLKNKGLTISFITPSLYE